MKEKPGLVSLQHPDMYFMICSSRGGAKFLVQNSPKLTLCQGAGLTLTFSAVFSQV